MNRARLLQLIETYGAWPDRWPEAERDAALEALAQVPAMDDELRAAQALDAALDAWSLAAPRTTLARGTERRMLTQRPAMAARRAARRVLPATLGRSRTWLSGAGLAAACVAGVLAGVQLGDIAAFHASDVEQASKLLDGGGSIFDAPVDGEKSG